MRVAWILGWAIPSAWFAERTRSVFPGAEHLFVAPTPDWSSRLAALPNLDWLVGYSLGARLLLEIKTPAAGQVALIAPFLSFPAEAGQGGRVSSTQVRYLARWLKRDRPAALADFYQRAGLRGINAEDAGSTEDLLWGLEILQDERPLECHLLGDISEKRVTAFCGADDPLVDAGRIAELIPGTQIVAQAGHEPLPLMEELLKAMS